MKNNAENIFNEYFEEFLKEQLLESYFYKVKNYAKYGVFNTYEIEISNFDEFVETNYNEELDEGIASSDILYERFIDYLKTKKVEFNHLEKESLCWLISEKVVIY